MLDLRKPIIAACALVLLIVGAVFLFKKLPPTPGTQVVVANPNPNPNVAAAVQNQDERAVPAGMREYQSVQYHFSLFYPQELTVDEHAEGGGATTITFQNTDTAEGFQVFIVPYTEPQVSEQRFKQDEPSGVRESLATVTIGGATGAAFYSTDAALGDTREIWFVHGGFLYEVTTIKPLDSWLTAIIQTWEFI